MKTIKPFTLTAVLICMIFIVYGNKKVVYQPAGSNGVAQKDKIITGTWQAVSSSGGFTGKGFTLDFETLILKDNDTFELMHKDSVIAHGKVTMGKEKDMILGNFIFEKKANVQLALDPEKYMQLSHADTLNLVSPCCDRYNIKLARKK